MKGVAFAFNDFLATGRIKTDKSNDKNNTAKKAKKVYSSAFLWGKTITALPSIKSADAETEDFVKGLVFFI